MHIDTIKRTERPALPQLSGLPFLTDGGLETSLIFGDGIDLPSFAAFVLLESEDGRRALRTYFERYADIAASIGSGFILESPTWRCSPDWGRSLGYSAADIARLNREAIALMAELRASFRGTGSVVVSGCIGPRGDGYSADTRMTIAASAAYHGDQIAAFRDAGADMVSAITMTHIGEAAGIALAARAHDIPCAISFTVETDGRLPSGEDLAAAITATDRVTGAHPAYYMVNCAHPDHFDALMSAEPPFDRIRGIRANASRLSHAELDACEVLDDGDPAELGANYRDLCERMPQLNVFGGCCGTDHRHIAAIAGSCID